MKKVFAVSIIVLITASTLCHAGTIHINAEGTGDYPTIQAAIDVSVNGDTIIVSPGTYVENINFNRPEFGNVTLTSTDPNDPTIVAATIIDGGNSSSVVTVSMSCKLAGLTITNGNSQYGGGINNQSSDVTIENCTISNNTASNSGGGLYNWEVNQMAITNCTITGNSAVYGGGIYGFQSSPTVTNSTFIGNLSLEGSGIYNRSSSPSITDCTFRDNLSADNDGAGSVVANLNGSDSTIDNCVFENNDMGGIANGNSSPVITNCTFDNNSGGVGNNNSSPVVDNCTFSNNYGMGMSNWENSSPIVNNCAFINNDAGLWPRGGGMYNSMSSPIVRSCLFSGNIAEDTGGGMHSNANSSPTIVNCTFVKNISHGEGGGIYASGGMTVINSILWGNTAVNAGNEVYLGHSATGNPNFTYCNIKDSGDSAAWDSTLGIDGGGNIDVYPLFVDPNNGDYHLKSAGWRWDEGDSEWAWDDVTSPCIDAGNPGSSLADEAVSLDVDPLNRFGENVRINMGAYGGTVEASMPPYHWALLADINNDGTVDAEDMVVMADGWLNSESEQPGDLSRDGVITLADFVLLADDWLKETSWYR